MAKVQVAPSHRMDCIKEYYFSKKNREIAELRKAGRDIISLGIGSPDMPPAQSVIDRSTTMASADFSRQVLLRGFRRNNYSPRP